MEVPNKQLVESYLWHGTGEYFDRAKYLEEVDGIGSKNFDVATWNDISRFVAPALLPAGIREAWTNTHNQSIVEYNEDLGDGKYMRRVAFAFRVVEHFTYTLPMLISSSAPMFIGIEVAKATTALVSKLETIWKAGYTIPGFMAAPVIAVKRYVDTDLTVHATAVSYPFIRLPYIEGSNGQAELLKLLLQLPFVDGAEIDNAKYVQALQGLDAKKGKNNG